MVIDHRTSDMKPDKLNEHLKLYEIEVLRLQLKYLAHFIG